ncbi:MAG: hypothetical protein FJZ58_02800 [Chlamydiae bacterium]|nr:hypothetical protein [Chlamydiota bacterium]
MQKDTLISFFSSCLPTHRLQKERYGLLFFHDTLPLIYLFLRPVLPRNSLRKSSSILWIFPDKIFYRPLIPFFFPSYLLRKELETYQIYDQRFLHHNKRRYRLPQLRVTLEFHHKTEELIAKERELLHTNYPFPFYCKGDCSDFLQHPDYHQALKQKKLFIPSKLSFSLYEKLLKKLDQRPPSLFP